MNGFVVKRNGTVFDNFFSRALDEWFTNTLNTGMHYRSTPANGDATSRDAKTVRYLTRLMNTSCWSNPELSFCLPPEAFWFYHRSIVVGSPASVTEHGSCSHPNDTHVWRACVEQMQLTPTWGLHLRLARAFIPPYPCRKVPVGAVYPPKIYGHLPAWRGNTNAHATYPMTETTKWVFFHFFFNKREMVQSEFAWLVDNQQQEDMISS